MRDKTKIQEAAAGCGFYVKKKTSRRAISTLFKIQQYFFDIIFQIEWSESN